MQKLTKMLAACGAVAGVILLGSTTAVALWPSTDENGNYITRRNGRESFRISHTWWQVADSDPAGLNCRRYDESINSDDYSFVDGDYRRHLYQFPVVGTLPSGSTFEVSLLGAIGPEFDDRDLPWLYVRASHEGEVEGCFVRANSAYIRPIPEPDR